MFIVLCEVFALVVDGGGEELAADSDIKGYWRILPYQFVSGFKICQIPLKWSCGHKKRSRHIVLVVRWPTLKASTRITATRAIASHGVLKKKKDI
jgi:hypothetical protein